MGQGKSKNPPVIWGLWGPVFSQTLVISETYFCELVLGFLPDRMQTTAQMFSGKWISIIIEKKLKFRLNFAMGPQNVRKSRAIFTKKIITREQNEIYSPNLIHMWMTKIFGPKKKKFADLPLGGAINIKKLFLGNRRSDRLEIWYTVSLCKGEQKIMRKFAFLKKHGRHWPN